MKRKSFLSALGKGALLTALLPELALSATKQPTFFLLITGGGVAAQDLKEIVFKPILGQSTNLTSSVHDLWLNATALTHGEGITALTGLSHKDFIQPQDTSLKTFSTSHQFAALNTENVFSADKDTFRAALDWKKNHPQQSVICYLNEADAAHYSSEKYAQALMAYAGYAKQAKEEFLLKKQAGAYHLLIASELGRDPQENISDEGWHHVCPESRKTACLWISPFANQPALQHPEQILPYLQQKSL
jgi:hypothetical protein